MTLSFGEKLRNLREECGMTQTALAKATQMTQRRVSYIECGVYEPSMADIISLCQFFHISADYLLGLPRTLDYPER